VAGRVLVAAADGTGPQVGARVVGHPPQAGWAEQVAVKTSALATLPDNVSAAQAATLGVAGLTALRLLRAAPDVTSQRVLITGASGGVGHFFVELAALRGARVAAVARTPGRGEGLLSRGAEAVASSVEAAEGPFAVIVESVSGASLVAAAERSAPGGTVFWIGRSSGEPAVLDFIALATKAIFMKIIPWSYWQTGADDAEDLATLVRLVAADHLHPAIGTLADWSETDGVLAALRARGVIGSAVLTLT